MALTAEQQSQLDMQVAQQQINDAVEASRREHEKAMENLRHANAMAIATLNNERQTAAEKHQAALQASQSRLELIRIAKEALTENRRTKPAATASDISPSDIVSFANALQ